MHVSKVCNKEFPNISILKIMLYSVSDKKLVLSITVCSFPHFAQENPASQPPLRQILSPTSASVNPASTPKVAPQQLAPTVTIASVSTADIVKTEHT